MRKIRRIFIFLLAVAAAQCLYYYPQMPQVMASHFDGAGVPNGWSNKPGFFAVTFVMVAILATIYYFMPLKFPEFRIRKYNLPNREYWLAPQRREQTYRIIRKRLLRFGSVNMLLMIGVLQLVFDANLMVEPRLSQNFIWILGVYFLYFAVWFVQLYDYFRRVPRDHQPHTS